MNTISSLETTDLPAAYHIEQRAHAFPWSEKTFASNQGERYLNFQLTQNGKMAAFAITQVVLDEATLFNIAVDPDYQRQGLGRALLEQLMDELPLFYPQIKDLDCAALGGLDEEKKVVVEKYLLILQTDTPLDKAQLEKIEEWASRIIGQEVTASWRLLPGISENSVSANSISENSVPEENSAENPDAEEADEI